MMPFIRIAGLSISTWRLAVLATVLICWVPLLVRAKRLGYPFHVFFPFVLFALPAGTLGGHLFNKLIPLAFGITKGIEYSLSGLTIIGSIIAVLIYALLYIKFILKAPFMRIMDAAAFTFPLSAALGRVGCLLNGCCFGWPAPAGLRGPLALLTMPLSFYAPHSDAWNAYPGLPGSFIVWDLPLVFMLQGFAILVITEALYRYRKKLRLYPGTVFAVAGTLYAGGRFFIEFMRNEKTVGGTLLNPWQTASLALFLIFFAWLCGCLYKRARTTA
ncbi:MAG: prolipoprotein diacylglyceryl transferase [Nitrospiraceae bacterium]|nr:prolipoprotein diacylglyceryl transferase [Nitrospiraceae bacterium]